MTVELKFLNQSDNDRRKAAFEKHEKGVGKAFGGVTTVGSGNKGMKGDVWAGDRDAGQSLMVECKGTEKALIVLKWDWLRKVVKEAREARKEPVLAIRYHVEGRPYDYGLIPWDRYADLMDYMHPMDVPQWPDHTTSGDQITLNHRWFEVQVDAKIAGYVAFTGKPRGSVTGWVVVPLDRLQQLYEEEAARIKAA